MAQADQLKAASSISGTRLMEKCGSPFALAI